MDNIVKHQNFWSENDDLVLKAIRDGFLKTQTDMWADLPNWAKTNSGLPSTAGTTASIAFIRCVGNYNPVMNRTLQISSLFQEGKDICGACRRLWNCARGAGRVQQRCLELSRSHQVCALFAQQASSECNVIL